ncbi:MAG: hypothetical protein IPP91_11195 [Betaproteobacteria bacterium]|nr:hypothetical protein [Betaproteobacteria bacterium]
MSLNAAEFTGFTAPPPPKRRGRRVTPMGPDEAPTTQETTMPTGVYVRKPKAAKAVEKQEAVKAKKPAAKVRKTTRAARATKATRKSPLKPASAPRFGVFDDGTIELRLPGCTGTIGTDDAKELVGFMRLIGIEA